VIDRLAITNQTWSSAFFMAAMPCSTIGPTTAAASCGRKSAIQTTRLPAPSAKTWTEAL
jgi:hypothetical protein